METLDIVGLIILGSIGTLSFVIIMGEGVMKVVETIGIFRGVTLMLMALGLIYLLTWVASEDGGSKGFRQGQIEALKGNYEYRMNIVYTESDCNYIPTDTTFTKIK